MQPADHFTKTASDLVTDKEAPILFLGGFQGCQELSRWIHTPLCLNYNGSKVARILSAQSQQRLSIIVLARHSCACQGLGHTLGFKAGKVYAFLSQGVRFVVICREVPIVVPMITRDDDHILVLVSARNSDCYCHGLTSRPGKSHHPILSCPRMKLTQHLCELHFLWTIQAGDRATCECVSDSLVDIWVSIPQHARAYAMHAKVTVLVSVDILYMDTLGVHVVAWINTWKP
mmetsp:Transcript_13845/g.25423  ORF Transcript_13845/g.25423 Transcript_13845/m.25423 type:complete len:231 (+) Transcript_13845:693-1385(+)